MKASPLCRPRPRRTPGRRQLAWLAVLLALAAGSLLLVGDAPFRATATPQADDRGQRLSIRTIESSLGAAGAQDFVIVFDGPVPDDRITYVEDITDVDVPALAYTTQEWRPDKPTSLLTCGAGHGGFSPPPPVVGQLDVLIPGDWFRAPPDPHEIVWDHRPEGQALKTPLCGPHDGYVQFAIWSPASHDPADVRVYLDGRTRLVVEIRPGRGELRPRPEFLRRACHIFPRPRVREAEQIPSTREEPRWNPA